MAVAMDRLGGRDTIRGVLTTTLLTLTLAPPPNLPLRPFEVEIDRTEYTNDGENVEIVAYDDHGTVIGVIALFVDSHGDLRIVSEYEEGFADAVIDAKGVAHVTTDLPAETVERRAEAIADKLATTGMGPYEGWGMCAAKVLVAVGACMGPHYVWTCGPGAFIAACECIPLMVPKDWEYQEC